MNNFKFQYLAKFMASALPAVALVMSAAIPAFAQSTSGSAPSQEVPAQIPAVKVGAPSATGSTVPTAATASPTAATASPTAATASPTAATADATTVAPAISSLYKFQAPTWGEFKLRAGIKTTDTTARLYQYNDENGVRYKQKHEYYLGFVHASGWGTYGQAVTAGTEMAGNGKGSLGGSDASATLLHPDLYKGTSLTLSGQFRRYFAVSDRSKNRDQKQWAYYLYTGYKLPKAWAFWNQSTPRFFDQNFYKVGDTTYYFEDVSNLTKSLTQKIAVGIGQWTQVEWHDRTKTGISVDASIFARFTPIANLWIEPRLVLPAYVHNVVYDAARTAALDAARAELYAQLTL